MDQDSTDSLGEINLSAGDNLKGLTTRKAIEILANDIEDTLGNFEVTQRRRHGKLGIIAFLRDGFHHCSYMSLFRWSSIAVIVIQVAFLLTAFICIDDPRFTALPVESIVLLSCGVLNIYIMFRETKLRHFEMLTLTRTILAELKDMAMYVNWSPKNYPHLHSPMSPCITLQWTRRDNVVVNLPWSLLVKGDIILLRPGQKVPGKCKLVEENPEFPDCAYLSMGDTYSPYLEGVGEGFSSPKARSQLQEATYTLLETPYIINLKIMLLEALNRPITMFSKQRHYLFAIMLEFTMLPVLFASIFIINLVQVFYGLRSGGHWVESLLVMPVSVTIPLVPIVLPTAWIILNWFGTAVVMAISEEARRKQDSPTEDDPLEGTKLDDLQLSEANLRWRDVKTIFWDIFKGRQQFPVRTANLIHVLASVTNLCCVDKKGILSWPNPTAERLFFLKNKGHHAMSKNNIYESDPSLYGAEQNQGGLIGPKSSSSTSESECVLMSLTHDHTTAFGLRFDDPYWRRYLLSLKPLGLNILLNTCNPATQNHYTRFCSHITCEAMFNEDLVPVSQRRCLCELPMQMGFSTRARHPFHLEHQLCTFRHVPPDMAYKDRLARSLMTTKVKFPFPHMVSVLLRDLNSGKLELMSQGTADIILDSCTDYWDGYDVCPLTAKDRKKILDFYHRTSLSAYCTAFAYRPTSCDIKEDLTNFYMELPLDPTHLYQAARMPTPHISTEALFGDEDHTEYEEIRDVEDSFRMQCKQIFIGMVTMQYQAKTDMVRMIEQLDEACIRFVHFSKENELRSQVFSEKMGLESGWNCHISLLPDKARAESGASSHGVGGNAASMKTSGLTLHRQSTEDLLNSPLLSRTKVRNDCQWDDATAPVESGDCLVEVVCGDNDLRRLNDINFRHGPRSRSSSDLSSCDSTSSSSLDLFDMSNRARLPKGIENVRPHLENVDNVPLLVSLFTDCNTPTIKAMLDIMQEYTEVTVLMGSTANAENMVLFMQADLCLGIDPLQPQVCMKVPVGHGAEPRGPVPDPDRISSPSEISMKLNSLPCSLSFHKDDHVSIARLTLESRHFMSQLMNCFQFWASCCLSISTLLVLSSLAMLPPLLSSGDVLWLACVCVPALSLSLVFSPTNPSVMNEATGKNKVLFNEEVLKYILSYYVSKFGPSVLIILLTSVDSCCSLCSEMATLHGATCVYVFHDNSSSSDSTWVSWTGDHSYSLAIVQTLVAFQLVFYFCTISVSFVHKMYPIWTKHPVTNHVWTVALVCLVVLQLVYGAVRLGVESEAKVGLEHLPWRVYLLSFLWPVVLLPINELIKRREIRVNVRYQKRARLEFGTKLGMNSPF